MTEPEQHQPPEVIESRRIHKRWIGLRIDTLRHASGRENQIDVIEHRGGVTLLAFDDEGRVLLVRQYRHAAGRVMLELPAGTIDPGEAPEVCAERELQEETGYKPGHMERLGGFFSAPGYCDEYLHIFLCRELIESKLQGDEESISAVAVPLDELVAMIASGEIEDAKTAAALLLYQSRNGL
ncbi:MAG: NUDIX hydrolase [Dehalococcoidia bacterium]